MTYWIRPLGRTTGRPAREVQGVDYWCWADHNGLSIEPRFPSYHVPTGFVWGWGPDVWVRWRTDAHTDDVGAELRRNSHPDGFAEATVQQFDPVRQSNPGGNDAFVPAVTSEPRFLRTSDTDNAPRAAELRGQPMTLYRVTSPVSLLFFSLPSFHLHLSNG